MREVSISGTTALAARRLAGEERLIRLKVDFAHVIAGERGIDFLAALELATKVDNWTKRLAPGPRQLLRERLASLSPEPADRRRAARSLFEASDSVSRIRNGESPETSFEFVAERDPDLDEAVLGIHFENSLLPESPFSGFSTGTGNFALTREDLRQALLRVPPQHRSLRYGAYGGWLLNFAPFVALFPPFQLTKELPKKLPAGLSVWGQFYRADGTLNEENAARFVASWEHGWSFPITWAAGHFELEQLLARYGVDRT